MSSVTFRTTDTNTELLAVVTPPATLNVLNTGRNTAPTPHRDAPGASTEPETGQAAPRHVALPGLPGLLPVNCSVTGHCPPPLHLDSDETPWQERIGLWLKPAGSSDVWLHLPWSSGGTTRQDHAASTPAAGATGEEPKPQVTNDPHLTQNPSATRPAPSRCTGPGSAPISMDSLSPEETSPEGQSGSCGEWGPRLTPLPRP